MTTPLLGVLLVLVGAPRQVAPAAGDLPAEVRGTVRSVAGAPIAGAAISIPELNQQVRTDPAGAYRLPDVPAGSWRLQVAALDYDTAVVHFVARETGTLVIDISLAPAAAAAATVSGVLIDASAGSGIPQAHVWAVDQDRHALSDAAGRFRLAGLSPGPLRVRVERLGYMPRDTVLTLHEGEYHVSIALELRPVVLDRIEVEGQPDLRAQGSLDRMLFDREPSPGLVGVTADEIRATPAIGSIDVLRTLQSLPGVVATNDLSTQLNVRGGGPDQTAFYLDGARILAPYHLFGFAGAFNPDALSHVEFYRGALPARLAGGTSSVVDLRQAEPAPGLEIAGGLTVLGVRGTALAATSGRRLHGVVAARRSHADVFAPALTDLELPYAFSDVQGRFGWRAGEGQELAVSVFASDDRFSWRALRLFDEEAEALASAWSNRAIAASWNGGFRAARALGLHVWASSYEGELRSTGVSAASANSAVQLAGARLDATIGVDETTLLVGGEVVSRTAEVWGDPGSFVDDRAARGAASPALYAEVDTRLGAVRFLPGIRVEHHGRSQPLLVSPRLRMRLLWGRGWSLSGAASRTHQELSTLWDDRYLLPGAPFYFLRPDDAPRATADGVQVELDRWPIRSAWRISVGAYGRRFDGTARWRPVGNRTLDAVEYNSGRALGLELSVERLRGPVRGHLAYTLASVEFDDRDGARYAPPWDRRHALDLQLTAEPRPGLTLSGSLDFGSGLPYWAPAGTWTGKTFGSGGQLVAGAEFAAWGDRQLRFPPYLRVDLAARWRTRALGAEVTPYISLVNVTNHYNVLSYSARLDRSGTSSDPSALVAVLDPHPQLPFLPTLGVDVRW